MNETLIEARGLTSRLRGQTLLDALYLDLSSGSVTGLLGAAGAGKTTALRLILGLERPDSGNVRVLGQPAGNKRLRSRVAACDEEASVPPRLRVRRGVMDVVRLRSANHNHAEAQTAQALAAWNLENVADAKARDLSRSARARLALCLAFVGSPDVILLDEPGAHLDAAAAATLRSAIAQARDRGAGVLVATREPALAEDVCDRIVLLRAGQVSATGSVEDLTATRAAVDFEVEGMTDAAMKALRLVVAKLRLPGLPPRSFTAYLHSPERAADAVEALVTNGTRVLSMTPRRVTLADIMREGDAPGV